MTITVRSAVEADAPAACHVLRRSIRELCSADHHNDEAVLSAWLENKTTENVAAWVRSKSNFSVVAVEATEVRGFALLQLSGEVNFCYVVPEVLRRGAGKLMLRALEEEAARCGLKKLSLTSTLTAKPFYERQGYVMSGAPVSIFGLQQAFPMAKHIAVGAKFLSLGGTFVGPRIAILLFLGVIAAFWWVPGRIGDKPTPSWLGVFLVIACWGWVFNHLPRLGARAFVERTPLLKTQVALLLLITGVSLVGFVV